MNRHVYLEPTEEGAKLNLPFELQHKCKVVYKKDPESDGYLFHSLWDDSGETHYDDEHIIVPLQSTFNGYATMNKGQLFANVVGSKDDRWNSNIKDIPSNLSWQKVLELLGCDYNKCVTDGYFYYSRTNNAIYDANAGGYVTCSVINHNDKNYAHGSHIVVGTESLAPGINRPVYLFSLCARHNTKDIGQGTGVGYYMKAGMNCTGIELANYLLLRNPFAN